MKISISEIIRALSISLDLAEMSSVYNTNIIEDITNINYSTHKFNNHAQRTAYIALELANSLKLDDKLKQQLYISSLLHDIGATNCLTISHSSNTFIKEHCVNGAYITNSFPIFECISNIILYHHENWNGSGPMKFSGQSIPLESQIIRVSDLVELLYDENKPLYIQKTDIMNWVKSNEGILFSKELTNAFIHCSRRDDFWFNISNISHMNFILNNIVPKIDIGISINDFEKIAYIFSNIIDSKSKFTAKHSREISNLAYKVSRYLNYSEEKCTKMKIAGLLHDVGKLAIPSEILDKNGSLSNEEFYTIKSHVYYTKLILDRISGISDITEWASNHHEKLNGEGYPRCLSQKDLSEECCIMTVCDIYQALTEDRPYRKGLSNDEAFSIMKKMCNSGFISEKCVGYLKDCIGFKSK